MSTVLTYSASEAKAKFAELLDHVERGQMIQITRRGKPIATLEPHAEAHRNAVAKTLRKIHELAREVKGATVDEILAARHEGHKY